MKKELTVSGIFRSLAKGWWMYLIVAVLFAVVAFFYSQNNYRKTYVSHAQLLVQFSSDSDNSATASGAVQEANYAQKMLNTYKSILQSSHDFKAEVQKNYSIAYETVEVPKFTPTLSTGADTQLIDIQIMAYRPEHAHQVCQVYTETAPAYIAEVTDNKGKLTVTDQATLPTTPANSDNSVRNALIAGVLGFLLPFAMSVVVDLFDVRIKAADDLRNTYHYPVIGEIPDFERYSHQKSRRRYGGYYNSGYGYGYGYGGYYGSSGKQKGGKA